MRGLLKVLLVNQFIALVIALFLTLVMGNFSLFWNRLAVATVNAQCIGSLSRAFFGIKKLQFLRKNLITIVLGEAVVVLAATAAANFILGVLWDYDASSAIFRILLLNVGVGITVTLIVYKNFVYKRNISQKSRRILQLEKENALAKLASLRARLNPHFLFNTLSVLSELAYVSPEKVESTVINLSRLYRAALDENRDTVTLKEELALVKNYLEVEKVRLEDRLDYEIIMDEHAAEAYVPMLSVEVLVENAVIHGISKIRRGGKVSVEARIKEGLLVITVKDDGAGFSVDRKGGFGLKGVRERLNLMYGNRAEFAVESERDKGTVITMEVPFENEGAYSGG